MADPQVKVTFKADTTELKSGMDQATSEAERKVKELEGQVDGSSRKMEAGFDKVSDAAKGVGDAARTAASGVKDLGKEVTQAASGMEKDLKKVNTQLSAMKAFQMGGRAIGIAGGMAQEIAKSYGADDTASLIGTGTNVLGTAAQGAAAGFAFAGPMGAAIGGLTGAAQSLLKAGNDLQEAAKGQDQKARDDLEAQRRAIVDARNKEKWTAQANELADSAFGERATKEGKDALASEMDAQRSRLADLVRQRDSIALNYNPEGDNVFGEAERMRALNDSIAFAEERLQIFAQAAAKAEEAQNRASEAADKAARAEEDRAARERQAVETETRRKVERAESRDKDLNAARGIVSTRDYAVQEARRRFEDLQRRNEEAQAKVPEVEPVDTTPVSDGLNAAVAAGRGVADGIAGAFENAAGAMEASATAEVEPVDTAPMVARIDEAAVAGEEGAEDLAAALEAAAAALEEAERAAAEVAPLREAIAAREAEIRDIVAADLSNTDAVLDARSQAAEEMRRLAAEYMAETDEDKEKALKDQLKEAQSELAGTQKELEGVGRTTVGAGATDSLTRIGGGGGYASYNNSVSDNVKTISNQLKELIKEQQAGVETLNSTLQELKANSESTWG